MSKVIFPKSKLRDLGQVHVFIALNIYLEPTQRPRGPNAPATAVAHGYTYTRAVHASLLGTCVLTQVLCMCTGRKPEQVTAHVAMNLLLLPSVPALFRPAGFHRRALATHDDTRVTGHREPPNCFLEGAQAWHSASGAHGEPQWKWGPVSLGEATALRPPCLCLYFPFTFS